MHRLPKKSQQQPTQKYLLRSKTLKKKVAVPPDLAKIVEDLSPLNLDIELVNNGEQLENRQEDIIMATKQEITDLLKSHKSRKSFQPNDFYGKTTDNARDFLSSFNNYCKLNAVNDNEKILSFQLCLKGTAMCWYLGLPEESKKNFDTIQAKFEEDYLKKNNWLNTTRLENRKLLKSESAEKYITDMSDLALLVGASEDELSKALIRGLPNKLRWHVVSFNPTTLSETIQRILLGEATIAEESQEEVNAFSDNTLVKIVTRLDERLDRLEETYKSAKPTPREIVGKQNYVDTRPTCTNCGIIGHIATNCFRGNRNTQFNHNPRRDYNNNETRNFNSVNTSRNGVFFNRNTYQNNSGRVPRFNNSPNNYQNRNFGYRPKNEFQPRM